jgi:hypothetical protein
MQRIFENKYWTITKISDTNLLITRKENNEFKDSFFVNSEDYVFNEKGKVNIIDRYNIEELSKFL